MQHIRITLDLVVNLASKREEIEKRTEGGSDVRSSVSMKCVCLCVWGRFIIISVSLVKWFLSRVHLKYLTITRPS